MRSSTSGAHLFLVSSLVGVAVMIVLLPFPGYIAKMLQAAQRQRMKKVDILLPFMHDSKNSTAKIDRCQGTSRY